MQAFGTRILAFDPYVTSQRAQQLGVTLVPLDELLEQSDFVTIHMPKTPETTGMISDDQLKLMKRSAFIVNVARGGLIDEDALYRALVDGEIAGAGLDVFVQEPPTDSPLLSLPNVIVTPHLGASTDEAQEKAGVSVAKSVRLALSGELVPDAVNVAGGVIDTTRAPRHPAHGEARPGALRARRQPGDQRRHRGARRDRGVRRERAQARRAQGHLHEHRLGERVAT